MTEDQARITQCCGPEGCGYVNPDDNIRYCVGSACMAWRWDDVPNPEYERMSQSFMAFSGPRPPMSFKSKECGYCGLAGRP